MEIATAVSLPAFYLFFGFFSARGVFTISSAQRRLLFILNILKCRFYVTAFLPHNYAVNFTKIYFLFLIIYCTKAVFIAHRCL